MDNINKLMSVASVIGIVCVLTILGSALYVEFFLNEEPCPLCELQRVAFINIGIALIMNLRFGNKVSHWALVILSALAGISVSIRQILLHINDPVGFGDAFFDMHMYTWCFIGYSIAIIGSALLLLIYNK